MTPLTEVQRQIDQELEQMTGLVWLEGERVVYCSTTGYSLVKMTHRFDTRLEAELVRRGKIHND
jgi:hypothetical protein